jgi:isochorismate synthase
MVRVLHNNTSSNAPKNTHPPREEGLYFRVSLELPQFDPWSVAEHLSRPGESVVHWGRRDVSFVALGAVVERCFEGTHRFMEADRWAQDFGGRLLGRCDNNATGGVPLFVGGFSFADEITPELDGPWLGWRPGLLRVPRLVLYAEKGRYLAVLTERLRVGQHPAGRMEALREEIHNALSRPPRSPPPEPQHVHLDERDGLPESEFRSAVSAALNEFSEGDASAPLSKVVLSRRAAYVGDSRLSPLMALKRLRERFQECTTFSFHESLGRQFLGASPELLVRKRGSHAQTRALAGTVRLDSPDGPEGLLNSDKDQREHAYVVEAIESALEEVATSVTSEGGPHLRTLRRMVHLETCVEAALRPGVSLLETVACLHPTPAVGGFPREAAMRFLSSHERTERGWYAGPIGWIDDQGDGEFHVALRCGVVEGRHAWAFAGAGIVEGSDVGAEWQETESKLGTFAGAIQPMPESV